MKTYAEQFYYSWPLQWMEVSGQLHSATALLLREQPPVPIEEEAAWAPGAVGKRMFAPDGSLTPTVVRRYTDWAISALSVTEIM
jgi:hypothetical protein